MPVIPDVSVSTYHDLASSGAGCLLLLVDTTKELKQGEREAVTALEEHALSGKKSCEGL